MMHLAALYRECNKRTMARPRKSAHERRTSVNVMVPAKLLTKRDRAAKREKLSRPTLVTKGVRKLLAEQDT